MAPKRNKTYNMLACHLGPDPAFCHILATAADKSGRQAVADALRHGLQDLGRLPTLPATTALYRDFLGYCHRNLEDLSSPSLISAVLDNAAHSKKLRSDRKLFVFSLGLNWKAKAQHHRCAAKLATIPRLSIVRRTEPYPPPNSLIADSPETAALWAETHANQKLPDKRLKKLNLLILDQQLVMTIDEDQSQILVNESGHTSGVVWRNFVLQPSVLASIVATGKESADVRTNIRVSSAFKGKTTN